MIKYDKILGKLREGDTIVSIADGLVPKGAYSAATDYAVGDSVDYQGSSYVMFNNAAAGTVPTDTTYWQVLANKGATGAAGADGTDGADGLTTSVNGVTQVAGAITIDQDDVGDGTTYKQYSDTEKTKLAGIATGAEVNVNADWNSVAGDSEILNKPSIPTQYTDEQAQDAVGSILNNTGNVQFTYDDATPKITASVDLSGKQDANAVLTELTALTDPAANRVVIWNDTSNNFEFLDYANWNTAYGWGNHASAGYVTGTPWTAEGYLTSLAGAVLTDQTVGQTIGLTGARLTKLWATDITCTNAIAGSVTGNAGTVTNATLTTALTVNTGTVTLTGNVANSSVLTIGAGAVGVSGTNTGDQTNIQAISDTMANFDTALSDGNFAFAGGAFHDGFSDFVANEHIDWTADQGAVNIHAGNIPDLSGTYQPLDADLTAIAGLSSADGNFIVGSATGWVAESGATARTSLGLGTIATAASGDYALVGQTMYIGTTQVAINRASAALTLAGLTLTTPNIGAATGTSLGIGGALVGIASFHGSEASHDSFFGGAYGNTLNFDSEANADTGAGYVNFYGYQGGQTKFRDFHIANGKGGTIAFFDGSSGNMGLGTVAPNSALSLWGGAAGGGFEMVRFNAANVNGPYILMAHSKSSTVGTAAYLVTGDELGKVLAQSYDTTLKTTAGMYMVATENHAAGACGTKIDWRVTPNGSVAAPTTGLTLDQDGTVIALFNFQVNGNTTLGNASTDTITHTGRMVVRTLIADPTSSATAGTVGEIAYYNNKFYGKTTSSGTDTNWIAFT